MSIFLSFPRMIFHLFHIFLSFFLLLHFLLVGISFLWSSLLLPYHFLHFLVSSFFGLSLFLCFHLFMVDFSLVRLDCPSFFARLCGLLESIGRKRPKVGLFVGRDCPYRFILLFLFPLVHRLVGISQTLTMFGEEEVSLVNLKQACFCLRIVEPLRLLLRLLRIRLGVYVVLLRRRKKRELGIVSNFTLRLGLGFLIMMIGLVIPTLTKCAFMRLTLLVAFVYLFTRLSESFSFVYNLLLPNLYLIHGG